jgi:hypothetical protein
LSLPLTSDDRRWPNGAFLSDCRWDPLESDFVRSGTKFTLDVRFCSRFRV